MTDSMEWKIYTRGGDQGETSLIGGKRVPKSHQRVESYGTVDELNSLIGMLRDQQETAAYQKTLLKIQETLFTLESILAASTAADTKELPPLRKSDVVFLEKAIDRMNETLPALSHFVLPGGHAASSWAHLARTVCRRSERQVIRLAAEEKINPMIIPYLNRLSDYLFVLARRLAYDLGATETLWNPVHPKQK